MSALARYVPGHDRLLCIDSDGCAFDTMGIKHKECFCPAFIEHFDLQAVAGYAREAWAFVNLYSQTRGVHRLEALLRALDLLAARREVVRRGFTPPPLDGLRAWMRTASALTNSAMRDAAQADGDPDLRRTLCWSEDVNARIARMVRGVPPFPGMRESLRDAAARADIVVVSATPSEALLREWAEHGLSRYVRMICGQEAGKKREIIAALSPHYGAERVLMIGDAPGDLEAAKKNGAQFFPIRPGQEDASWAEFPAALALFLSGNYDEGEPVRQFTALLPGSPPWETA